MSQTFKPFNILTHQPANGLHLVEASAGTGKTYSIVGLVLHLLLSRPTTSIGNILVVTFTNAATGELTVRVRQSLSRAVAIFSNEVEPGPGDDLYLALAQTYGIEKGLPLLRRALGQFDEARISTIHSFCSQVLQESAFECGVPFSTTFIESDLDILLQASQDFWRTHLVIDPLAAVLCARWNWTPEALVGAWRHSRRFPDTEVLPTGSSMEDMFSRLADLLSQTVTIAGRSPLLQAWNRDKVFKKNQKPQCPNDDPAACLTGTGLKGLTLALNLALDIGDPKFEGLFLKSFLKGFDLEQDPLVKACQTLFQVATHCRAVCLAAFVLEVDQRFENHKRKMGLISYDDLLITLERALSEPQIGRKVKQAVDNRFHAALIDEFQDTDHIQYTVFRQLFGAKPCYIIGDPKQAIYSFRGADVFTYLEAAARAGEHRYTLETNWRSHTKMVEAVNCLFDQIEAPFVLPEIGFSPARAQGLADSRELQGDDRTPLTWLLFPEQGAKDEARRQVCEACGDEIVRLLSSEVVQAGKRLGPGKIAILVNTNDQARMIRQALAQRQVPAVLSQAGNIFDTEEMTELRTLLRAILRPDRSSLVRAACLTRIWGMTLSELVAVGDNDRAWQQVVDRLDQLRSCWRELGFMAMFEEICSLTDLRCRFLGMDNGRRSLTNILQAAELAHCIQTERGLTLPQLLDYLDLEVSGPGREGRDVTELSLETDSQAVQVVTVHKSKGLEYEVVFCPFLWEGRSVMDMLPAVAHKDGKVVCDFGSQELELHQELAEGERLAEDLRKLYVALTRAKQRCYLVWGRAGRVVKGGGGQPGLTYLLGQHLEAAGHDPANCGPSEMKDMIHKLSARFPELMTCLTVDGRAEGDQLPVWQAAPQVPQLRGVRQSNLQDEDRRLDSWRLTSFSSMSRGSGQDDHDYADHGDPALSSVAGEQRLPKGIFAFTRGAHAGNCLHGILEKIDFSAIHSDQTRTTVQALLESHDLASSADHQDGVGEPLETIIAMLADLCSTPVSFGSDHHLVLECLNRTECLIEWEFHALLQRLSPCDLATVIRQDGGDWQAGEYAERLQGLSSKEIHGFLKGFVDLVCRQGDRWYVIDWKSNHLGNSRAAYGSAQLRQAMFSHHYVLQYLLYTVALDRFLKRHQPGYTYQENFGGIGYAFLRGVGGKEGAGWYVDRPPIELIEGLSLKLIGS